MTKQQPEEALKLPTFGQRKMASRVCVVDGKPHVRKFLCETLEEIGFITCDCAHVAALDVALDEPLGVDLIVVGSANGVQAATVVEALAAKAFGGMVQGFLFAKPMTAQKFALTSLRRPVTIPE